MGQGKVHSPVTRIGERIVNLIILPALTRHYIIYVIDMQSYFGGIKKP